VTLGGSDAVHESAFSVDLELHAGMAIDAVVTPGPASDISSDSVAISLTVAGKRR
jgi:hypothetical protein